MGTIWKWDRVYPLGWREYDFLMRQVLPMGWSILAVPSDKTT